MYSTIELVADCCFSHRPIQKDIIRSQGRKNNHLWLKTRVFSRDPHTCIHFCNIVTIGFSPIGRIRETTVGVRPGLDYHTWLPSLGGGIIATC